MRRPAAANAGKGIFMTTKYKVIFGFSLMLLLLAGVSFTFSARLGGHVPLQDADMATSVPGVFVAGDITGVEEASTAMEEGRLAGIAAAGYLGLAAEADAARDKEAVRRRIAVLRSGPFGLGRRQAKEEILSRWKEAAACRN